MPRRMITSNIWFNEKFGSLPDPARLLFIGMFNNADDDGRLKASPAYLRAIIFPYDENKVNKQITEWLNKCNELGLIHLYSKNGADYLCLTGWTEHQVIRKDLYHPSKLPPPNDTATKSLQPRNEPVTEPPQTGDGFVTQYSIGKYSIGKDNIYSVFEFWNLQEIIKHRKLTDDIKRAINGKLKDYSLEDIQQAIKNYAEILKGDEYYWSYTWTLKEFLSRGLEKFGDINIARQNYKLDNKLGGKAVKKGGDIPSRYKPVN